ncbi:MAG: HAD-IC family P-type ATPase, partial [Bacteroidota bacterium]|nr:HAD-IC family P-type ATPase [Bacteroidota bacterium]
KTGTLTTSAETAIRYEGLALTEDEESLVTSTLRASNHPLSRSLYAILKNHDIQTLDEFGEEVGHGIYGTANHNSVKIGSYDFVGGRNANWIFKNGKRTVVHISTNATYKGCYVFYNRFRESLPAVFEALSTTANLAILSGDNTAEKQTLERLIKQPVQMYFNQKPDDKLNFIKSLQQQGKRVLMIGDGLNDSGALAQSDVGIAISENINVFSPACDGILDASRFKDLPQFIQLAKRGKRIIKWSFVCSLLYNLAGLVLAISGNLKPVYAAILMPLSSISIVVFTTLSSYFYGSKLKQQEKTEAISKS